MRTMPIVRSADNPAAAKAVWPSMPTHTPQAETSAAPRPLVTPRAIMLITSGLGAAMMNKAEAPQEQQRVRLRKHVYPFGVGPFRCPAKCCLLRPEGPSLGQKPASEA